MLWASSGFVFDQSSCLKCQMWYFQKNLGVLDVFLPTTSANYFLFLQKIMQFSLLSPKPQIKVMKEDSTVSFSMSVAQSFCIKCVPVYGFGTF